MNWTTNSLDEYISLSVRIALDKQWRLSLVDKIKSGKHLLFNDNECVAYLDRFFKSQIEAVGKRPYESSGKGLLCGK